jgi:phosphatidylethanolamine-binding protein (PEBP) family uncharacterized protein
MSRITPVAVAGLLTLVAAATACSTGDGTTLRPPTEPPPTVPDPTDLDGFEPGELELGEFDLGDLPADGLLDEDFDTVPEELAFEVIPPWIEGGEMNPRHGCDGPGLSPSLVWTTVPDGTNEIVVVMSLADPTVTAPGAANEIPTILWLVAGIDPILTSIPEGGLPSGATLLPNSSGTAEWTPPCPEPGQTGRYLVSVHALAEPLGDVVGLPVEAIIDLVRFSSISTAVSEVTLTR